MNQSIKEFLLSDAMFVNWIFIVIAIAMGTLLFLHEREEKKAKKKKPNSST